MTVFEYLILISIGLLILFQRFRLSFNFGRQDISTTRESVSQPFRALQGSSKNALLCLVTVF